MNAVKYIAKSSERPDGWYGVVEKECNGITQIVFEEKCIDEEQAMSVASDETIKLLSQSSIKSSIKSSINRKRMNH